MKLIHAIVLAPLLLSAPIIAGEPVNIGSRLELMIDDHLIDTMSGGVRLQLHKPVRRNVALVTDEPWEGNACSYCSVFQDGDRYRMYFGSQNYVNTKGKLVNAHEPYTCYAESNDGIHWTKPKLGLIEFDGSKQNNIVLAAESISEIPVDPGHIAVFKDSNPKCPRNAKYKAVIRDRKGRGLYALKSSDGLHFSPLSDKLIITDGAFDSQNLAFWDSFRGEYRAYFRDFREGVRGIKTAASKDFLTWSKPQWLVFPGAPNEHLYTNQIAPYYRAPHILFGFPLRYSDHGWVDSTGKLPHPDLRRQRADAHPRYGSVVTDGLMMTSRDALTFKRWGEAILRPGLSRTNSWVYGDKLIAWGILSTESDLPQSPKETSIYATEGYWTGNGRNLRRYSIRIDGFVSMQARRRVANSLRSRWCFQATNWCSTTRLPPLVVSGSSFRMPKVRRWKAMQKRTAMRSSETTSSALSIGKTDPTSVDLPANRYACVSSSKTRTCIRFDLLSESGTLPEKHSKDLSEIAHMKLATPIGTSLLAIVISCWTIVAAGDGPVVTYGVRLRVTSELKHRNVPMDPLIDFGRIIQGADIPGVLDPNSVEIIDVVDGQEIPFARMDDFAYGDKGRIAWVIEDPTHREYEIRFKTCQSRPALIPQQYTPLIGVGDLLRYNAGVPRPITLIYLSRMIDLNGDGRPDMVGCWNYAHDPAYPWDGIFCHPRVGDDDKFEFGDLIRLRYVDTPSDNNVKFFGSVYMGADFADFDKDGLVDLVYAPGSYSIHGLRVYGRGLDKDIYFYRNTGRRDAGGMPVFATAGGLKKVQRSSKGAVRSVDLNRDGLMDVVVFKGGSDYTYLKNTNPKGLPFQPARPVTLKLGGGLCFYDVDGNGLEDAITLKKSTGARGLDEFHVVWQRNLGGDPPRFAAAKSLDGIDPHWPASWAPVTDGPKRGLLVQHDTWQRVSFYEQLSGGKHPRFKYDDTAVSDSALVSLSDQAAPFLCDWDGDGDLDLLVGHGYGWPRIVINDGTNKRPAFREAQLILSEGKPIRLLRDEILGPPHCWHNMGYLFPVFIDWDDDDLPDLMLPNETNRIFWYKNIGTRNKPVFGRRRQVIVEGFPDSAKIRTATAQLVAKSTGNVYPTDKSQPFHWRSGAAFVDFNGDGLTDVVTRAWSKCSFTLFLRYRDEKGVLRLREDRTLKTVGGRQFHGSRVNVVDWDGDGILDIIHSEGTPQADADSLFLARNARTNADPVFEEIQPLRVFGRKIRITRHGPHPWVGDMDGDGKPDILCYTEWSVYPFYRHAAIEMKKRPKFEIHAVRKR